MSSVRSNRLRNATATAFEAVKRDIQASANQSSINRISAKEKGPEQDARAPSEDIEAFRKTASVQLHIARRIRLRCNRAEGGRVEASAFCKCLYSKVIP